MIDVLQFAYWLPALRERLQSFANWPVPADATQRALTYRYGECFLVYEWERDGERYGYKISDLDCHSYEELGARRSLLIPRVPVQAPPLPRFLWLADEYWAIVVDLEHRSVDFLSTDVELAMMVADRWHKEFSWEVPVPAPEVLLAHITPGERVRTAYDELVPIFDPDTQELLGRVRVTQTSSKK